MANAVNIVTQFLIVLTEQSKFLGCHHCSKFLLFTVYQYLMICTVSEVRISKIDIRTHYIIGIVLVKWQKEISCPPLSISRKHLHCRLQSYEGNNNREKKKVKGQPFRIAHTVYLAHQQKWQITQAYPSNTSFFFSCSFKILSSIVFSMRNLTILQIQKTLSVPSKKEVLWLGF